METLNLKVKNSLDINGQSAAKHPTTREKQMKDESSETISKESTNQVIGKDQTLEKYSNDDIVQSLLKDKVVNSERNPTWCTIKQLLK